jgi:hypothetical protein
MTKKVQLRYFRNLVIEFESDYDCGGLLDTTVRINCVPICVIAGTEIDNFYDEIRNLIQKFHI